MNSLIFMKPLKILSMIKISLFIILVFLSPVILQAQSYQLISPNQNIKILLLKDSNVKSNWYLKVDYIDAGVPITVIPEIRLGLMESKQDYSKDLELTGTDKEVTVVERYLAVHGKRSNCLNEAIEQTFHLKNVNGKKIDFVVRAYNDGVAFRYVLNGKKGEKITMEQELTSFEVPNSSERYLQQFVRSYEGPYPVQTSDFKKGEWGYPALFKMGNEKNNCWMLLSEAGVYSNYCATKLSNLQDANIYKLTYPAPTDGNSTGRVNPSSSLPWKSPWRVAVIGQLSNLVESTLINDVSDPSKIKDESWIIPGSSSWVYWANNHGTMDFKKVNQYTDLAVSMGWKYTLFDWEWDVMSNGGNVEDAARYANSKGIKPLLWYNSGGPHNDVTATPRDRMLTRESRAKEFAWLNKVGIYGVKIDFFLSDKQDIIKYYIDILEDAAKYKLMVNFHGSTVPRGWSRTYPNLMSMEAVYGAEQYNNGPDMTTLAPKLNTTLPYTRNIIGSMDYTPVTFTNSQHQHSTSYAHELALSVVFESAFQHMADRPEGYLGLTRVVKDFLKNVPAGWDDTKFVDGYPGQLAVLARRSGRNWYLGGINGESKSKKQQVKLSFLEKGKMYKATIIQDGDYDTAFSISERTISQMDILSVDLLPRGGFAVFFEEQ